LVARAIVLTYRRGVWGPWTGTPAQLVAEVQRIRLDLWGRCWARLAGAQIAVFAPRAKEAADPPRTGIRLHVKNQAAALAVWLWRHGAGDLAPHGPVAVTSWFFDTPIHRRGRSHKASEEKDVERLLEAATHALATWRHAVRSV
jgi:hypothetical protein